MKPVVLFLLLLGAFVLPTSIQGTEISVGTTKLSIPPPPGYVPLTEEMQPYADFAKRFVPSMNEQFAVFLTDADAAVAAKGEMPKPVRWFYVQTAKSLINQFITSSQFTELKKMIKSENAKTVKEVEAELPGLFDNVSKGLSKDYNVDVKLAMNQIVPLPPHYESDRAMSYSALTKSEITGPDGKPAPFEGVVTATFVHLQGKVLFLYAIGSKDSLEWSRVESQKWADAIVAANPSTGSVAVREFIPGGSQFDWGKVVWSGLAGAVVFGVIAGIGSLFKRNTQ